MNEEKVKSKIRQILELQEKLNERTRENWRDANFEWYRAIWVECAELLDHYGWKWWKKQTADMPQVQLEIIDIFHFVMSDYLQREDENFIINSAAMAYYGSTRLGNFRVAVEDVAKNALTHKSANFTDFFNMMFEANMDMDDLFKGYVGKNVLNFFRQDHGYNEGTYLKTWNGREDNVVLAEIADGLDPDSETFQDDLYSMLETTYKGVTND